MAFFFGSSERVIFVASSRKVGGNIATRFGLEEEAMSFGCFVMVKMRGMVLCLAVMLFIVGRERKSRITLVFPLICEISKEYCENHAASLSNWAFTALFGLNLSIPFEAAKSVSTRKWCPIR